MTSIGLVVPHEGNNDNEEGLLMWFGHLGRMEQNRRLRVCINQGVKEFLSARYLSIQQTCVSMSHQRRGDKWFLWLDVLLEYG